MGKYFEALEQADRERALREHARPVAASATSAPVAPATIAPVARPTAQQAPPSPLSAPEPEEPTVGRASIEGSTAVARLANRHAVPNTSADGRGSVEEHLVSLLAPTSFGAEQYRTLRHKVEQLHGTANLTIVAISSAESGDGKTMTTINLAGALGQAPEARVLLVDADLRRSSMAERLGLDGSDGQGLISAIVDPHLSLRDVAEPCPAFNLSLVRAGRRPSAPYELLKSPRLGQLLDDARQQYDYVVLDMPPLIPLPDCRVIGRWVDGFLIVVTAHKTRRGFLEEALKVLDPEKIIGLVFNGDDQPRTRYVDGSGWPYGPARRRWWAGFRNGHRASVDEIH